MPREKSRKFARLFRHPRKFEGVLRILWQDNETAIFAVPQRSGSLAHVVPEEALVKRAGFTALRRSASGLRFRA